MRTADVAIVGAGIAGMVAAVSAAQTGVRTVLIEKRATFTAHGAYNGAVNSRLQKTLGIEIDKEELIAQLVRWAGAKVNQRLLRLWVDRSGETMDWLVEMAEAAGQSAIRVDTDILGGKDEFYREYPTAHLFPGLQGGLMKTLRSNAKSSNVEICYQCASSTYGCAVPQRESSRRVVHE